jgi:hypothetical protein
MILTTRRIALAQAARPAPANPPRPRDGKIALHDSSIGIWEENVDEASFKTAVFDPIIRHLRATGWTVGQDPKILKHYRCLRSGHRYARKGALEASLEMSGRHIQFKMFQNVANVSNRHGGKYDFDKLQRMPYLLRMQCLATMRDMVAMLRDAHGYEIDVPSPCVSELGPTGVTAMEYLDDSYARCCHTDKELGRPHYTDYNRKSADGRLLEHGQTVWVTDRRGRWLRGTAYYNLNNMWWVVLDRYQVRNVSSCEIHTAPPADPRARVMTRDRRARLEDELSRAVRSMDFGRAQTLRKVLFGDQPLFRIWSGKSEAWYRPLASGYSLDAASAGLYTRSEAEAYVRGIDYLKIVPVAA